MSMLCVLATHRASSSGTISNANGSLIMGRKNPGYLCSVWLAESPSLPQTHVSAIIIAIFDLLVKFFTRPINPFDNVASRQ